MEVVNLQERFLNVIRTKRIPATFYLVNGFQLKGTVISFDSYTVLIESNGTEELLFKHAISTIAPWQHVTI